MRLSWHAHRSIRVLLNHPEPNQLFWVVLIKTGSVGRRCTGTANLTMPLQIYHHGPILQLQQKLEPWLSVTFSEQRRAENPWCLPTACRTYGHPPDLDCGRAGDLRHSERPADAATAGEPRPSVPSFSVWRGGRQDALQNGGRGRPPTSRSQLPSTAQPPKPLAGQPRRPAPLHETAHAARTHCWVESFTRSF